jgi:hypothetical protein
MVAAPSRLTRGWFALALAGATLGVSAAPGSWVVEGACRDSLPHGIYELRGADGTLRAIGAFNKGARTGSFLFWSASGARMAQLPFDDDLLSGTVAFWYAPKDAASDPPPKLEAAYAHGARHGATRAWQPNGRMRAELQYDHGELVSALAYGPAGALLPDAEARAVATHDAAADAKTVATLEALVRDHPPSCVQSGSRP